MGKSNKQPTKQLKNKTIEEVSTNIKDVIYSVIVFVAVCALIFYPPYVRGLFFPEDMFPYHILTAIVFLLVWIDKINRKVYGFFQTPLDWAVAAYAGAYLLSIIGAIHIGEAFYGFLKALDYFMVYWAVSQMVRNYKDYVNVLRVLLASGAGVAVIGILAATGYSKYPSAFDGKAIMSTLQYSNATAAYLAVITLIAVTLWIREENRIIKLVYALAAFLMMLVVLATLSKGAWLIFILGASLCLLGMPGMYRIKSIYFLSLTCGAALITAVKFLPAIAGKVNNPQALPFIIVGIGIVVLGEVMWEGISLAYRRWGNVATALAMVIILAVIIASGVSMVNKAQQLGHELEKTSLIPELDTLKDLNNTSFSSRLDLYKWGLKIVEDYPVNGTGAGGWNALYHSYQDYLTWTTEVHNHFLQVWIEAGTIGFVAFLSIWVYVLWLIAKRYKDQLKYTEGEKNEIKMDNWVLNWGTFSAALAFGVHSAIDFDLSMGAMCVLLITLFALINAGAVIDHLFIVQFPKRPWISISCGLLLTVIMLIAGQRLAMAQNLDKAGKAMWQVTLPLPDDAVKNGKLAALGKLYEQAADLDPLNAGYTANIAQASSMQYAIMKRERNPAANELVNKTQAAIITSEKLSPRDIKTRSILLNSASIIGDYGGMVKQAESLVAINPYDIKAYEAVIQTSLIAAENSLNKNQQNEAVKYLENILLQANSIEKTKNSITHEHLGYPFWQGDPLTLSPDMQLSMTKAHYLLGNYNEALTIIQPYMNGTAGPTPSAAEIKAWYFACIYQAGDKIEAQSTINSLQISEPQTVDLYNKLISLQPLKANK